MPHTDPVDRPVAALSAGQFTVLSLTAHGHTVQDIARGHDWAPERVRGHLDQAARLLNAPGTAPAVHAAYEHGLLSRPGRTPDSGGWSPLEIRVWHALTGHPDTGTAARSLGHEETAVATIVDALLVRTGARSVPHLITHGHALGILGTGGVDPGPISPRSPSPACPAPCSNGPNRPNPASPRVAGPVRTHLPHLLAAAQSEGRHGGSGMASKEASGRRSGDGGRRGLGQCIG